MARHQTLRRSLLIVLAVSMASAATAQGLADAARRAEDQRKASAVEPKVLKEPARVTGPTLLSLDLIRVYVSARVALADVRRADRQLDLRMSKAMRMRGMRYYADFLPVLEGEMAIAETLAAFGFTPRSYLFVEEALVRGRAAASRPKPFLIAEAHAANVQFLLSHPGVAEAALERGFRVEQKLLSCCPVLSAD